MDPATIALIASLGLKGISALFGHRSQSQQANENRNATVAGLTLAQRQREDQRRARLAFGNGLMGQVPRNVDGSGGNLGMDPALYDRLNTERTYNYGATVPRSVGGTAAFLSGLAGGAADIVPRVINPTPTQGDGLDASTVPPDSGVDLNYLRNLATTRPH